MRAEELDLNLLYALDALLQERNVTRAGRRIGYSQSAMSRALLCLRRAFRDELLIRAGREYCLSPVAQDLVEPVREIIHSIDALNHRPSFDPTKDTRTFRIAVAAVTALIVIQPLLERIETDAPNVSMQIRSPSGQKTLDQLASGELDLGIWDDRMDPHLPSQELYEDRWVLAVWNGVPGEDRIPMSQLMQLRRLDYDWQANNLAGFTFKPPFESPSNVPGEKIDGSAVDNGLLALHLLRGTSMGVLTGELVVEKLRDLACLRTIELPFETAPYTQSMFWHPRATLDPGNLWLREQLSTIGAEISEQLSQRKQRLHTA